MWDRASGYTGAVEIVEQSHDFWIQDAVAESRHALPGRTETMPVPPTHFVLAIRSWLLQSPENGAVCKGCFWAQNDVSGRWRASTRPLGYSGGLTENPTYEEVCSGGTGHTETVLVVYDENVVSLMNLLKMFWESHDPTQGMRQGNLGTQYRSAIYTFDEEQAAIVEASMELFQQALTVVGYGPITTDVWMSDRYYAEHYHQQYLAKVPNGYCGLKGTGVGWDVAALAELVTAPN